MKMNKNFYKNFFTLYLSLMLQQVITLGVNLADNIMLGAYKESALAGVAAVNQVQFVYQNILMGLAEGLVLFCAQYWGERRTEPIKRIVSIVTKIALGLSLVLFAAASLSPSGLMHLFTDEAPIVREGMSYLQIIRFTYPFFALTQILLASQRSVGRVKIAFGLSVMTLCVNASVNYLLIFGNFGAPRLGTAGAAIGTLVARILETAVLLLYLAKKDSALRLSPRDFLTFDRLLFADYLRTTAPIVLVQSLWGVNTALQTVILGHMNSAAIAANSAASNLFLMVKSATVGASSAGAVMIGQAIGRGDDKEVLSLSKKLQRIFVLVGLASAVLIFFLRIPILSLYTLAPETRRMANTFLIILSVIIIFISYQMPTLIGIIRGGGNSAFVMKVDLISIWGIVIPLSLFMAFVVHASPAVVLCCLNADQVFKCVPAWYYANKKNWIRHLTR